MDYYNREVGKDLGANSLLKFKMSKSLQRELSRVKNVSEWIRQNLVPKLQTLRETVKGNHIILNTSFDEFANDRIDQFEIPLRGDDPQVRGEIPDRVKECQQF